MNSSTVNYSNMNTDKKTYGLSAIVLVYNGEPYLEKCLNSLVNQTLDNLEILLINDASTDNSLSICKRFEKKYKNIRVIDKRLNEGLATSANLGISLANGEYVILVDNDDIIPNYAYEKLYKKAKQENADICIGKANFIVGNSQIEFDFRENYVWRKEQIITDINKFPELFEDAFYWNKIIRKDLLINNDVKLPTGMIYADRYFSHMAYTYANKIAIIPDCVYLWRQIKSSLSTGRANSDNYINRLDSYDLDLDYFINSCDDYFKILLRRILVPIRGVLNSADFEEILFNRVRILLKDQESKFANIYENDLNQIDNIYAYLITNNYRKELKELLRLSLKNQREIYDENNNSYWKLPLFRNHDVQIPDDLFKIKYLMEQFVNVGKLNFTRDKVIFSDVTIPRHLSIEKLQLVLMGVTSFNDILEDNVKTFDFNKIEKNGNIKYSLEILSSELSSFEMYTIFLKAHYKNEKFNKIHLNESSIKKIICNVDNNKPIINSIGQLSLITQNLENEFEIDFDNDKLKILIKNKDNIKKNLKMLIRKDSTNELIYLSLNKEKTAFELEWKFFLDQRSPYSLFLTIFNNEGKIKKNVRFRKEHLQNFDEKLFIINNIKIKIYINKNNEVRLNSF